MLEGARKSTKMEYLWGWQLGVMLQNRQEHSFHSDNAREAITKNWSGWLEELDSIQKKKRLEKTYIKCTQLLQDLFNVTHPVLLLHAHKCWLPGGVLWYSRIFTQLHTRYYSENNKIFGQQKQCKNSEELVVKCLFLLTIFSLLRFNEHFQRKRDVMTLYYINFTHTVHGIRKYGEMLTTVWLQNICRAST